MWSYAFLEKQMAVLEKDNAALKAENAKLAKDVESYRHQLEKAGNKGMTTVRLTRG